MTAHLPGNPYHPTHAYTSGDPLTGETETGWVSQDGQTDATLIALNLKQLTLATMALAYEQRTANLLAANMHPGMSMRGIRERLGEGTQRG